MGRRTAIMPPATGGLAGLIDCVGLEYARQGVRAAAIAPGPGESQMFGRWMPTKERREMIANAMPTSDIAYPDDMARFAVFLFSDDARRNHAR